MKCLINGTGIEEGLYPLTCEMPAGLLSVEKNGKMGEKTILDRFIEEMEENEQIEGYLVVSCEKYAGAYEAWRERQPLKDKIQIAFSGENKDHASLVKEFIQEQEADWLVMPHNAAFSMSYIIEKWRNQAEIESCVLCCGNETNSYELPVLFLNKGQLSGEMKKLFFYRPEKLIKSLPEYERLVVETGGPVRYREFSVQAYTQERYGDYYISSIRMENTIPGEGTAFAYIQLHNGSNVCLTPERARVGYHLWLEQTYENSFQLDKIPMPQTEPLPLPVEIPPGESRELPILVEAPAAYGKYYLQFDLEIDGVWQAKESNYFCLPSVSFIGESVGPYPGAVLAGMKKVYLTGLPESANAGEQLEAEALKSFVRRVLPGHYLMEISSGKLEKFWNGADRLLNEGDRMIPYASGVLGAPECMGEEHLRRRTAPIATHPKFLVPFVIPPQHMAFPEGEEGKEQIGHSAAAYKGGNYFLLGGNENDYCFLKENFYRSNLGKAPRLSFSMDAPVLEATGDDFTVVVCGGSREGFLDSAFRVIDENGYHRMFLNLDYNAYQPGAWFGIESRRYLIDFCYRTIGATKAVVTDSVYGLSYALMCHRPCVVLGCMEEKEWFVGRSDVLFVERAEQLKDACMAILQEKGQGPLPASLYADMERFLTL